MKKKELDKLTGAEFLRLVVSNLDTNTESFNDRFTVEELLLIGRMALLSEWDFLPDQWTERQVKEALLGHVPAWTKTEKPKYGTTPKSRVLEPGFRPRVGSKVRVKDSEIKRLGIHYSGKIGVVRQSLGLGFWTVFWGTWTAINVSDELEPG